MTVLVVLSRPWADILPVWPSHLVNKVYILVNSNSLVKKKIGQGCTQQDSEDDSTDEDFLGELTLKGMAIVLF